MADCPRCQLMMQTEVYEGHDVHFCNTCWGHWLDTETFTSILESEVYSFGTEERRSVLAQWSDHDSSLKLSPSAPCPECGEAMVQEPVDDLCPVVIDRCAEHGIWLDTAEIKQIQVFVDTRK